ncbi:hypothetical protein [Stutzerimonas balearica]|uniref:hypothetical protein n=1 Tax=Stutzerimonas balearica TaxID=74829 RepID=UPI0028A11F51|nr:hypothetical protein [Stutzerimonas balearica]
MAKHIRALLLPNMNTILISLIAQVVAYDEGIGILNERGKMIGWIEITTQDPETRDEHFYKVVMLLNELINDPRHAVQPDFSFLTHQ